MLRNNYFSKIRFVHKVHNVCVVSGLKGLNVTLEAKRDFICIQDSGEKTSRRSIKGSKGI